MSFQSIYKVFKRHLKFITVMGICAAAIFALGAWLWPKTYEATASMVVSSEAGAIGGIAEQQKGAAIGGSEIKVTTNTSSKKIIVVATSNNGETAVSDANLVLSAVQNELINMFPKVNTDEQGNPIPSTESTINKTVSEAKSYKVDSRSPILYCGAGLIAGLLCSALVIAIKEAKRNAVYSKEEVEEITGLPVLGILPTNDKGKRLNANIEFANEGMPTSVCIIPGDINTEIAEVVKQVNNAEAEVAIQESVDSVLAAKDAEATVLVAKELETSRGELVETVKQLSLAKANLVGLVYLM